MIYIKDGESWRPQTIPFMEWQPISTAPFHRNLELAVFDTRGRPHALVFPCRRILGGWIDAETKEKLSDLRPTHWREWPKLAALHSNA